MTLGQYIENATGNVKIGTNGGGFLYCGDIKGLDVTKLDRDNVLAKVTRICNCKRVINETKRKLKNSDHSYSEYRAKQLRENNPILEYEAWLTKQLELIAKQKTNIVVVADRLVNYTHASDRTIIDRYASLTENNTTILIIEGDEVGKAWTTEEYRKIERRKNETIKTR